MKSAILDFGNVVALFDHRKAARQIAALSPAGVTEDEVYDAVFLSFLESGFDIGAMTDREFIERLRRQFDLQASDAAIERAWSDIFSPNPEMANLLPVLRKSACRIVLASNTNVLHFRQIEKQFAAELSHFDSLVLSFIVGVRKPDPEFFSRCLEAAHASPEDCIYVDDRADFVGVGETLGLKGVVYKPGSGMLSGVLAEFRS